MTPGVCVAMDIRFGATVEEFMRYVTDLGLDHVELKREYLAGHPTTPTADEVRELSDRCGVSVTYHAPFRDWNIGSYDEAVREDSVERVKRTLDDAAEAGAEAVVTHGGSVPTRYPEWVQKSAKEAAIRSLAECAEYAQLVGVPLCVENQPSNEQKRRYTTTPSDLAALLQTVDVAPKYIGVTLDVGHAKVNGEDWHDFVEKFGHRIQVCHLHDNDGTADQHAPMREYDSLVESIPANQFIFEMKSLGDVATSVGVERSPPEMELTTHE